MYQVPYSFTKHYISRYSFNSQGKKNIKKIVDFAHTGIENTYNLAFGDLSPDGSVDDATVSNNDDTVKVLRTVIKIIEEFFIEHPGAIVTFLGSSPVRMRLYRRILSTYYEEFSKTFLISALIETKTTIEEVDFEANRTIVPLLFLLKKIC